MKILKYTGFAFVAVSVWLVLLLGSSQIAYEFLNVLAYINGQCAPAYSYSCDYFEWDRELKVSAYILYFSAFFFIGYIVAHVLKGGASKTSKYISIAMFIFSFPTYTSWGVASNCRGFGGCTTGYYIDLVAPLIMTVDIFTLPSVLMASGLVWAFIHVSKVSIA